MTYPRHRTAVDGGPGPQGAESAEFMLAPNPGIPAQPLRDTASGGGNKPATLESGVTVQVPLFIEEGETIRVDTRSGEYVSRA